MKSSAQLQRTLWACATSSLSLVLWGLPARAEERWPVLRVAPKPLPELSQLPEPSRFPELSFLPDLESDSAILPGRTAAPIANPIGSANLDLDGLVFSGEPDHASRNAESDQSASVLIPHQSARALAESPTQPAASSFSNPVAQADAQAETAPQPVAPLSSSEFDSDTGASSAQLEAEPDPDATDSPDSTPAEPVADPEADETDAPSLEPSEANRWRFSVEPYFFAPLGVEADVTAAGRSASLDLDLGDILNLDRAFDAGLRLEAQYNRLGFILDGFYVSAADSGTVGVSFPEGSLQRFGIPFPVRLDADTKISIRQLTLDAAVSYRVIDEVLGSSTASYPRLAVAPIAGLRTRFLWQELEIDEVRVGPISRSLDREFSTSTTTVEPLLGTQIALALSDRWALNFRGDVSGFNINADQDFTWNLLLGAQYRISPNVALQLAYRFNGFDFEDGEGIRRVRLNLYQNGLTLSGIFYF